MKGLLFSNYIILFLQTWLLAQFEARATFMGISLSSDNDGDKKTTLSSDAITGSDYTACSDQFDYCTVVKSFDVVNKALNCSATLKIEFLADNGQNKTMLVTAYLWENGGISNHENTFETPNTKAEFDETYEDCRRTKM